MTDPPQAPELSSDSQGTWRFQKMIIWTFSNSKSCTLIVIVNFIERETEVQKDQITPKFSACLTPKWGSLNHRADLLIAFSYKDHLQAQGSFSGLSKLFYWVYKPMELVFLTPLSHNPGKANFRSLFTATHWASSSVLWPKQENHLSTLEKGGPLSSAPHTPVKSGCDIQPPRWSPVIPASHGPLVFTSSCVIPFCLEQAWPVILVTHSCCNKNTIADVQSLSHVWLFATSWTAAQQAPLSSTVSLSLPKFTSIESVMLSNHLILFHSLLLLPSIFPRIRVFSNGSALCIGWTKYWSFSFSTSPSNEYSGLISFRVDQFDLLAIQGTLKGLLQHHNWKASALCI